ncbi:MAG TPA: hypothetical protein VMB20_02555 [Candidatus Acidoferrum sp.]|nr:hypothetical protein [Candidatus Acidoferrum sp.]
MRIACAFVLALALIGATPPDNANFAALKFRNIGPLNGRIDTVSGVPGDPSTYYAGGLGGLFKTSDGGVTWKSAFNNEPVSSVNAIAVAPSAPSTVYIGTGETNLRNDVLFGDGVWRSNDAGTTWAHNGLDAVGSIAQIAVDPADAQRVFVAALGDVYGPSQDRGIYRTSDGGATWTKVLYTDDRTGGSSIAMDPSNTRHLLAGMWEGWRTPYHLTSGGANDGVYETMDGGEHWTRLQAHGLPTGVMGRIAIAFAPSNPKRVYALIESAQGTLWRSDDGGANWTMVNAAHGIDQRPFYFTSLTVDPKNADTVYFMSVQMWRSTDGGKTAKPMRGTRGGDYHQLWIDPQNPARMAAANDQGAEVSNSMGDTWLNAQMAIAQVYHVDTDDRIPYTICGEDQDSGSACGPSNSLSFGGISPDAFFDAGGGESGWIVFDKANSNLIYGDGYQGSVTQYDRRTGEARAIDVWPQDAMGWPAAPLKYRFQWTSPLAISPQHPHRLFMGANKIFQTDDGGVTWKPISPDLTRDDKSRQQLSGTPITPDNTSVEYYDVVFSIGPSPVRDGLIWAGTDDGRVWLTRDGGAHWSDVSPAQMRTAPSDHWLRVDDVVPSPFDAATAYASADAHKWGDRMPQLFVTHDYGATWARIVGDLPANSYTLMLKPDPVRRGMLYAGTASGLYYSFDEGAHWTAFTNGFPTVPVFDFTVQPRFDDLVVATHGRGIWILDDLHPLQEMNANIQSRPVHLFTLRDAYRFDYGFVRSVAQFSGQNPPAGAVINFWLAQAPAKDQKVRVEIFDGGNLVRSIDVKDPVAGVNRVWWNLSYDDIKPVKDFVPWASGGFDGPTVLPGTYRVRVSIGSNSAQGNLRVLPDPNAKVTVAQLQEQLAFLMQIRAKLQQMTASIEHVQTVKAKGGSAAAQADALLHKLYNPEVTQGEDALRYPEQVYGQLSFLASDAASTDAAPTKSMYAVRALLEKQADALMAEAAALK